MPEAIRDEPFRRFGSWATRDEVLDSTLQDGPNGDYSRVIAAIAGVIAQVRRGEETCTCGWCGRALIDSDVRTAIGLFDLLEQMLERLKR